MDAGIALKHGLAVLVCIVAAASVWTAGAAPAGLERAPPAAAAPLAEPEHAPAATLDVTTLATRLRKSKAINLRTKLAVKNESDDLLARFRAYHARHGSATLGELRRSYDSLFATLHSLLRDADPNLARDIDRSRAAIWAVLADPLKFEASASRAPSGRAPPT
jgi:hypothetical protein